MTITSFHSVLTVVGVVAFVAMVIWVFGKKQKSEMDRNAMIPLQDDSPLDSDKNTR